MSSDWQAWPGSPLPTPLGLHIECCRPCPPRHNIRSRMITYLEAQGLKHSELSHLEDLTQRPLYPNWQLSISHCPQAAIWAAWPGKNQALGVDLEVQTRIQKKVIERIANDQEIKNSLDWRLIFSAKEAGWKALNSQLDIPSLSHLHTQDWQSLGSDSYSFKLSQGDQVLDVQGVAQIFTGLQLCLVFGP